MPNREISPRRSTSQPGRTGTQHLQLTAPWSGKLEREAKVLDIPGYNNNWGRIDIDATEFKDLFKDYTIRDQNLLVTRIHPKAWLEMYRIDRWNFLAALSTHRIRIKIRNATVKDNTEDVELATLVIIALSIRRLDFKGEDRKVIGELAGLAPPKVMDNLSKFSWLPVLEVGDIAPLAHSASRSICHAKYPNVLSGTTGRAVGNLIASILASQDKHLQGDQDEDKRQIPTIFSDILLRDLPDKDKGAEVGFVFAGITKYIKNSGDLIVKKTTRLKLVMDTVLAGLTGVPAGGVVFAAIQPGLDYMADKSKDRKLKENIELLITMQNWYNDYVLAPLHRNGGRLEIEDPESKTNKEIKINKETFKEWYGVVMEFNGL